MFPVLGSSRFIIGSYRVFGTVVVHNEAAMFVCFCFLRFGSVRLVPVHTPELQKFGNSEIQKSRVINTALSIDIWHARLQNA